MDDERAAGQLKGRITPGIPIDIKDNIIAADKMMTTAGSLADGTRVQRDANLVSRLREGGAIILAKN